MAQVLPFLSTRYNADRIGDLAKVLTPPYDVITPEMQDELYARHSQNLIRVDLGKVIHSDDEYENRYTRASSLLSQWRSDGVLVVDDKRTFTAYEQTFTLPDGTQRRRRGIFGLVKLEDLGSGAIHAHEHTFDGPKSDRFKLLRATQCNVSPIYSVFPDTEKGIDGLIDEESKKKPWADFSDGAGVRHRAWIITSEKTCKAITEALADKDLYIADGHHRYETALMYRDSMREQLKRTDGLQPFDYTLMYLSNTEDEGTAILPIHRALARELDEGNDGEEFLGELEDHFNVRRLKVDLASEDAAAKLAAQVAKAGAKRPAIGVVLAGGRAAVLTFRTGQIRRKIFERKLPKVIRDLDVTLLHELIVKQTWIGNPQIELDDKDIFYDHIPGRLFDLLRRRKACAVFLMNAPTIAQMMAVAGGGRRMPHKSTFFYPKVITGLVMRDMSLA